MKYSTLFFSGIAGVAGLVLLSCGASEGEQADIEQPVDLKTELPAELIEAATNNVYNGTISGVRAVEENNGVYVLRASPSQHEGATIYHHGIFYNGNALTTGWDKDVKYLVFARQGETMVADNITEPLVSDTRFEGVWTELNVATGGHSKGDAVIDVNGADQYLIVDGPATLEGIQHFWDADGKKYYYADEENTFYSTGLVGSEAVSVNYNDITKNGIVFGLK